MVEKSEKKMNGSVIRLHPKDNVATAVEEINAGDKISGENITSLHKISAGHKMATHFIKKASHSASTIRLSALQE